MPTKDLETNNPFTLAPWAGRIETTADDSDLESRSEANLDGVVRIAVSSSARNDLVGVAGVIEMPTLTQGGPRLEKFSFNLGTRAGQTPFSGELTVTAYALRFLSGPGHRKILLSTVLTLRNPRQQSGQAYVRCIYEATQRLRGEENTVSAIWLARKHEDELQKWAKQEARNASREDATPQEQFPKMRSTVLGTAKAKLRPEKRLPDNVGKHSKRVDIALPGRHSRELYDKYT